LSFELAVQTSIYSALTANATLLAMVEGVYDSVPQTETFPYITIGEDAHTNWSTSNNLGHEVLATVNVWSRANLRSKERGRKETKTIQGEIFNTLNRASLTYAGYHIINIEEESSDSFVDADNLTRHGVQTFRVLIDRN